MASQAGVSQGESSRLSGRLWVAVRRFDDELAGSVLNRAFAVLAPGDVADLVVAPVLRRLGDSWHLSPRVVAIEHFTSQVVRSRFGAQAALGSATDRLAVCFAPAGEHHDLGVHLAAAALASAGWRTVVLGADTPHPSAAATIAALEPMLVVVGACVRPAAEGFLASGLAGQHPVLVGGAGFVAADADGRPTVLVHHGPFARVADVASELVDRVAGGRRR